MIWGSMETFLAMGGYAFYVWGSYGMAIVLLAGEILLVVGRRRTTLRRLSLTRRMTANDRNETPA